MPQDIKLKSAGSLKAFLSNIIDEGVKSALHQRALLEKEKQVAATPAPSSQGGNFLGADDDDDSDGSGDDQEQSSKTMDDESEKLKQGDIKTKDIVDRLNAIRSGRSFKDSAVSSSMDEYIESLSKPEKVALLAFLKGISQIVTGEVPAQQATDPGDNPSDVEMSKSNEPKVYHKTPNVIKRSGTPQSSGGGRTEDTSSPTPITPKRR